MVPSTTAAIRKSVFTTFWPGNESGFPERTSFSLAHAIRLPVKVRPPIKTEKIIVAARNGVGDVASM